MFLRNSLFAGAVTVIAVLSSNSAFAAEPASETEIKALRERLHKSDAAIDRLNRRLEELEKERSQKRFAAEEAADGEEDRFAIDSAAGEQPIRFTADEKSAEKPTLEKRVADIEKSWKKQEETNKKLTDADKKFPTVATPGATWKIGGRIHEDYWAFPEADAGAAAFEGENPDDRFYFRRARLEFEGDILDNMMYRMQVEFANANSPEYRDLYFGFKEVPWLQTVIIGNQKRPYGLDHLNSSNANIFMERPFIIEAFNQDARRLGVSSNGVSDDESWNWRYGVWNMENTQTDDGYQGDNYQLEVAGRLANTWWYDESSDGRGYGHWGVSGAIANPDGNAPASSTAAPKNEAQFRTRPEARSNSRWLDTGHIAGAETYELLGLESVFNAGEFQICGEIQNVWLQRETGSDLHFWGGYVYVSYFLTGEHMPWERKTGTLGRPKPFENFFLVNRCCGDTGSGWGAWQVALRYSYADLSDNNVLGGVGESVTLGLQWLWNANCRMQFDYTPYGRITDHAAVAGQTSADYQLLGSRFIVFF